MARIIVPGAEAILDKEFRVLDHGFVRLVDYLGGDDRIVAAARVSYGPGTKSVREDRALIHYLMRHQHTSPFEQVVLTFHVKLPIFVARQWVRHRTARLNEVSGRYSVLADEFYLPDADGIRLQSKTRKQSRNDDQTSPEFRMSVLNAIRENQQVTYAIYQGLIADDVARELARINLPLSLYTQWYWQIDLHNLFHFIKLRLDSAAQLEIQGYARVLSTIAKAVAPIACEAFEEHLLYGFRLSKSGKERLITALRSANLDPSLTSELESLLGEADG